MECLRLRIDCNFWKRRVELHIVLTDGSAPHDRFYTFLQAIGWDRSIGDRCGADESNTVRTHSPSKSSIHGSPVNGLNDWNGPVCVTHLRPSNLTTFQNHLRTYAKVCRLIQYQVRKFANLHRSQEV